MAYIAGAIAIIHVVFGWSFNWVGGVPLGWILIAALLITDLALES